MFDARHPDTAKQTPPQAAKLVPIKVPPGVLAKVAESFAASLSALQRSLGTLEPLPPAAQPVLDAALAEITRLERFGVQIQELARVLGGDAPVARERIDLAQAARVALAEWTRAAQLHGASLHGPTGPFELEVNGAALSQLLDLGLEYALHIGSSIDVGAGIQGVPALPMLTISAQRSKTEPATGIDADFDELHWLLFVQLARAIGLVPRRLAVGNTVTLMLGFPGADVSGPHDAAAGPAALPRTAAASGRRVLLIEPKDSARARAHRLMREVGMRVDSATTVEQARTSLHDGPPDAVVTGIPVDDERFGALLEEIRAAQPRLRVIELVDDDDAFSFSAPGSDSPARIGRHDMERTLTRALSQELDAAWAQG